MVTVNRLVVIPESPVLYEELTFREHIEFVARSYNQMNEETMAHAMELVEAFPLNKAIGLVPSIFLKRMKQKYSHRLRINARCLSMWSMNHF